MELFLLDMRKWAEFLLHPKRFFSRKAKIDIRVLLLEVLVAAFITSFLSEYAGFLTGAWAYVYTYTVLQRVATGFLDVLVFGVLAFYLSKLLKGVGNLPQNMLATALPTVILWVVVIFTLNTHIAIVELPMMLFLFAYTVLGLKYVNKYSWMKAVGAFLIVFFVSGFLTAFFWKLMPF